MWAQIGTIAWAQWRVTRNHLPRTTFGSLLSLSLGIVWYASWIAASVFLAAALPGASAAAVRQWLGVGLLAVFLYWQLVPLLTMTSGWSLDLKKLQIYPLSTNTLLLVETVLRVTASFEMVLILAGACLGLLQNAGIPKLAPFALLLYIPFNLLLSLAVRETLLALVQRNRFREIFTVLFVTAGVVPQILLRSGRGARALTYLLAVARAPLSPWQAVASLSTAHSAPLSCAVILGWIALLAVFARRQLAASLKEEELVAVAAEPVPTPGGLRSVVTWPERFLPDPMGALVTKELRALVRMPRFRVVFMLASFFSVVVLIPLMQFKQASSVFVGRNSVPLMNLYGLLILGDALMWNIFGFDRSAAQVYFVAPVPLSAVIRAKNVVAAIFMFLQSTFVIALALLFGLPVSGFLIATALFSSAVVGLFYIAVGNLSSVMLPRSIDPRSTMRKQSGGKIQLWIVGFSLGTLLVIGFAYLGGWAAGTPWATLGILAVEFVIAGIVYRISLESAVARALNGREELLTALGKNSAPVSA